MRKRSRTQVKVILLKLLTRDIQVLIVWSDFGGVFSKLKELTVGLGNDWKKDDSLEDLTNGKENDSLNISFDDDTDFDDST